MGLGEVVGRMGPRDGELTGQNAAGDDLGQFLDLSGTRAADQLQTLPLGAFARSSTHRADD